MEKLTIPKDCVIQGEVTSISNGGDIVIESPVTPRLLVSREGGIKFSAAVDRAEFENVDASKGFVDINVPNLVMGRVTASSGHLQAKSLKITEMVQATEAVHIEAETATIGSIQTDQMELTATRFTAQEIKASGEITLHVETAKVGEIHAKRVVMSGKIDCQKVVAEETVVVENGHISIKRLECPSFNASPDVTGIVVMATCEEVKAEGVRGFLHPNELDLLAEGTNTVDLNSLDHGKLPEPSPEAATDEPAAAQPPREAVEDSLTPASASDYPTVPEVAAFDQQDVVYNHPSESGEAGELASADSEKEDLETLGSQELQEFDLDANWGEIQEDGPEESAPPETVEEPPSQPWEEAFPGGGSAEDIGDFLNEEPEEMAPLGEEDPETEDTEIVSMEDIDATDPDIKPVDPHEEEPVELEDSLPDIKGLDEGEMAEGIEVSTESFDNDDVLEKVDAFDVMEVPTGEEEGIEAIEETTDEEDAEDIGYEDMDDSLDSGEILDHEFTEIPDEPSEASESNEDIDSGEVEAFEEDVSEADLEADLIRDLTAILDEIRAYFPEDNYPKFITQIQRYISDSRFNLFVKTRNKEAVLAGFDKFDHAEISALARKFFARLETFFQATG